MEIISQLLLFCVQPVLWIGLIRVILNSNQRIKTTRQEFHSAIVPNRFELSQFGVNLLLYGIILSLFGLLLGPIISFNWLIIYEFLLFINLLILPRLMLPITIAVGTSLIDIAFKWFSIPPLSGYLHLGWHDNFPASANYVVLVSLILIALGLMIKKDGGHYLIPIVSRNQRNIRVAGYPYRGLTIAPMLMLVPGDVLHHLLSFWPTFNVGAHSLGLVFVPVLLGTKITVFRNAPRRLLGMLGNRFAILGLIGLLYSVGIWLAQRFHFLSFNRKGDEVMAISLIVIMVLAWLIFALVKRYDSHHGEVYSETVNGVRVLGIEPHTPAAKMGLEVGDVILDVNDRRVNNEGQFYEALLQEPTYCRLKVRDRNNELRLTESAIYNNSPHEIGIILFKNKALN